MSNLLKKPVEIAPGVYDITWYRRWGRRYRSYLFDDEVPTLVDTCYAGTEYTDELIAGIDETGVRPEQVVITHGDSDHIGGLGDVVAHYGIDAVIPAETEATLDVSDVRRYTHGDSVGAFEAIYLPGHASDHYVLLHDDADLVVLGDAMVGADIRGLPAGYLILHAESVTEDIRMAERNLEKLVGYDFDIGLVFHGSSVMDGASDKIERFVDGPKKER